jgi:hypothetical protein
MARHRRTPQAEPAAVRLVVAGPGLPMIASEVTRSGTTDPQRIAAASSGSGTAAAILRPLPETLAASIVIV